MDLHSHLTLFKKTAALLAKKTVFGEELYQAVGYLSFSGSGGPFTPVDPQRTSGCAVERVYVCLRLQPEVVATVSPVLINEYTENLTILRKGE